MQDLNGSQPLEFLSAYPLPSIDVGTLSHHPIIESPVVDQPASHDATTNGVAKEHNTLLTRDSSFLELDPEAEKRKEVLVSCLALNLENLLVLDLIETAETAPTVRLCCGRKAEASETSFG